MTLTAEIIGKHFPYYLSDSQQGELLNALNDFNRDANYHKYYFQNKNEELLQGDVWAGFEIVRFEDGQRDFVKGIILSNSCDIAVENGRVAPPRMLFAPLIELSTYVAVLKKNGKSDSDIANIVKSIKEQRTSAVFYLPAYENHIAESIALLDNVFNIPLSRFNASERKSKFLSLNRFGFYLFLFKLAVHFCRMHEEVDRE